MRFRLDGVITVVDAINGGATLDAHVESVKQAAVADRLVLTKSDLADTPARRDAMAELISRLKLLNPAAPVLDAARGEATPDRLLDCGLYDPSSKTPEVNRWLSDEAYAAAQHQHDHHHHDVNRHDDRIRAFTFATETPIPARTFEMFIDLVRSLHGPKLLRLKGIVKIAEFPEEPLVVHGVQHVMHPPVQLERWPDDDRRTRIVVIARELEPEAVTRLFDAFLNRVAVDQPDRAALIENPLLPFGGIDR
jgi:G3E family GTPase